MGICGLNSFLKDNPQLSVKKDLHDEKLVIDGKNLAFHLFIQNCSNARSDDWRCDVYGGNMVGYAEAVRLFFENIDQCGIEPIVVISGRRTIDDDSTLIKVNTQFEMSKSIQEDADDEYSIVVPSCIKTVFSSILSERGIEPHVTNNYTPTIRDLANENNCVVLTNDGAFFIYSLKQGHILLDRFDHKNIQKIPNRSRHCFPDCSIYKQRKLLEFFPRLNLSYMPLLAVSLTYTKSNNFKRVSQALCDVNTRGGIYARTEPQKRIVQMLTYLEGKPLKNILNFFLSRFDSREQPDVWVRIHNVMVVYWSLNDEDLESKIQTFYPRHSNCKVAHYLASHFTSGDVNTIIYDIISGQIHFNYPEIDDLDQNPSFHLMLRPLSVVVALLKKPSSNREKDALIILDQPYCQHTIEPMDQLEGFGSLEQVNIYETISLPLDKKKQLIQATFWFDDETFEKMTQLMKERMKDDSYSREATICMLLIRYMNHEAKQNENDALVDHVLPEFIQSILITILYYATENAAIDYPEGEEISSLRTASIKNSAPLPKSEVGINYRFIMHLITKLQTAYKAFFLLNTLLDYPFRQPKLELFFNGVLIYRLTKQFLNVGGGDGKVPLEYQAKGDFKEVTSIVLG